MVNEVAGNVLHGLSDAPRRLVWEVRVGVGGVDVESVPKVEPNRFSCSACVLPMNGSVLYFILPVLPCRGSL